MQHFKKYKEDIIKYHVKKGAVRACELSEDNDKFYNNSVEAMNNKLIKHWQNLKKTELIQFQESDILETYLGLSSPYVVRNEFSSYLHSLNFRTFNFCASPLRAYAENLNFPANNGERIIRNKAIIIFDSSCNAFSSKENIIFLILFIKRDHSNQDDATMISHIIIE